MISLSELRKILAIGATNPTGEEMKSAFSHWIKQARDTQDEEIDCSECLDHISTYVDLELEHENVAQRMPQVKQHLAQCKVCREEYQVLKQLASLETDGELPANEELMERLKRHAR